MTERKLLLCLAAGFALAGIACTSSSGGGGKDAGGGAAGAAAAGSGGGGAAGAFPTATGNGGAGGATGGSAAGGDTGAAGGSGGRAGAAGGGAGGNAGGASGSSGAGGSGGLPDGGAALTLTSPGFTNGMTVPTVNTCSGANTLPELDWTVGPTGTQSYAIALVDTTIDLVHWAIWDLPTTPRALTATTVPAGAQQASFNGVGDGYTGPCPPVGGAAHTYIFTVYALDVATLPAQASQTAARTAIMAASIASGSLTGTFAR